MHHFGPLGLYGSSSGLVVTAVKALLDSAVEILIVNEPGDCHISFRVNGA